MDEYLTQIKSIADQLALAASPVDDEDLVLLILNGLPDEYNAFKTSIRTRSESISIGVLCSLLNSESIHVESSSKQGHTAELPFHTAEIPFAYHTSKTSSRGAYKGGSYRGRGRDGSRFFKGNSSSSRGRGSRSYGQNSHQGSSQGGYQGYHSPHSSTTQHVSSQPARSSTSQAYVASTSSQLGSVIGASSHINTNTNWFLDFAATSHMTNDLNNLTSYQPYHGSDQDKSTKKVLYKGFHSHGLYHLPSSSVPVSAATATASHSPPTCFHCAANSSTSPNWHFRLGHPSSRKLQYLVKHHMHQLSCPHTPAQNGVAERKHRHLIETTIALMHHSSLPLAYWFDALATSVFLINRLPTAKLNFLTPFEVLFQQPPDYTFLKTFSCRCYPWLKPYTTHKLQPRSVPCVFLGYVPSTKGYRCLDPSTGKLNCFSSLHNLLLLSSLPHLQHLHLHLYLLQVLYL
ncbi:hypothetical protein CsSME_00049783 [Camellia sinensis var. sinensis]